MSRRIRTFAALLFHVLLLQVSVLGGGMACVPAWANAAALAAPAAHAAPAGDATARDTSADASADPSDHAAHGASHGASPDGRAGESSGGPSSHHGDVRHCAAATGCAAVAVLGPAVTPAALAAVHTRAESAPEALPLSTRAAPEPPPPRA